MSTATTTREAALLNKFKLPELQGLEQPIYEAIVAEARRITSREHYRSNVERGIAEARYAMAEETFPAVLFEGFRQRDDLTGEWVDREPYLSVNEHNPVILAWAIDAVRDPQGIARLDAIHEVFKREHRAPWAWNSIAGWGINGALRSWSTGGITENAGPRLWRLTPLGDELLEVVFS